MEILDARIVKLTADDVKERLHERFTVPDNWRGDYLELTVRLHNDAVPVHAVLRSDTSPQHTTSEISWNLDVSPAVRKAAGETE